MRKTQLLMLSLLIGAICVTAAEEQKTDTSRVAIQIGNEVTLGMHPDISAHILRPCVPFENISNISQTNLGDIVAGNCLISKDDGEVKVVYDLPRTKWDFFGQEGSVFYSSKADRCFAMSDFHFNMFVPEFAKPALRTDLRKVEWNFGGHDPQVLQGIFESLGNEPDKCASGIASISEDAVYIIMGFDPNYALALFNYKESKCELLGYLSSISGVLSPVIGQAIAIVTCEERQGSVILDWRSGKVVEKHIPQRNISISADGALFYFVSMGDTIEGKTAFAVEVYNFNDLGVADAQAKVKLSWDIAAGQEGERQKIKAVIDAKNKLLYINKFEQRKSSLYIHNYGKEEALQQFDLKGYVICESFPERSDCLVVAAENSPYPRLNLLRIETNELAFPAPDISTYTGPLLSDLYNSIHRYSTNGKYSVFINPCEVAVVDRIDDRLIYRGGFAGKYVPLCVSFGRENKSVAILCSDGESLYCLPIYIRNNRPNVGKYELLAKGCIKDEQWSISSDGHLVYSEDEDTEKSVVFSDKGWIPYEPVETIITAEFCKDKFIIDDDRTILYRIPYKANDEPAAILESGTVSAVLNSNYFVQEFLDCSIVGMDNKVHQTIEDASYKAKHIFYDNGEDAPAKIIYRVSVETNEVFHIGCRNGVFVEDCNKECALFYDERLSSFYTVKWIRYLGEPRKDVLEFAKKIRELVGLPELQ